MNQFKTGVSKNSGFFVLMVELLSDVPALKKITGQCTPRIKSLPSLQSLGETLPCSPLLRARCVKHKLSTAFHLCSLCV